MQGAPLPAARAAFDAQAGLVQQVVDRCGYQLMVDVAGQYPEPLDGSLRAAAVVAPGEVGALPAGLRCADLRALGVP